MEIGVIYDHDIGIFQKLNFGFKAKNDLQNSTPGKSKKYSWSNC